MQLKNFSSLLVILATLFFSACSKDNDTPATNFNPTTEGSSWTYIAGGSVFKLTATNRDTVAAGKTYKVLTNSSGPNNYVAKIGNDYYRFGAVAVIGSNGIEELYLKDNVDVNGTWSSTQGFTVPNFGQLTADLKYTVKEKGIARTVSSKSYSNVVHVRLDISVLGNSIGGGDFYYAEGIGMIENDLSISIPGQAPIVQSQLLTSYEIR